MMGLFLARCYKSLLSHLLLATHFVKFIYAAHALIAQHKSTSLQCEVTGPRILHHRYRQPWARS